MMSIINLLNEHISSLGKTLMTEDEALRMFELLEADTRCESQNLTITQGGWTRRKSECSYPSIYCLKYSAEKMNTTAMNKYA